MLIDKLEVCKSTRKFASETFLKALKGLLKLNRNKISEVDLRDAWLKELRKNDNIFSDGWYIPPPHGIAVLFGTDKDTKRISPQSLRKEEYWPRRDIFLNLNNGLVLVYASPIDKATGIIGDFGLAIYFGKNKRIRNHLKTCLDINKEVFAHITVNMQFQKITLLAHNILKKHGLVSDLASPSDPTGTNIGHTIPFSYEAPTSKEQETLKLGIKKWEKTKDMVSKKRRFVNSIETLKVKRGMAFTIEPRPYARNDLYTPMVWFHTVALIRENGEKELLTGFDEIFKLTGMNYMLK